MRRRRRSVSGIDQVDLVTTEQLISGDEGRCLEPGLGDEHAVEGVAMVRRQRRRQFGMVSRDFASCVLTTWEATDLAERASGLDGAASRSTPG